MQPRIMSLVPLLVWVACGPDQNTTRSNIIDGTPAVNYPASCYINYSAYAVPLCPPPVPAIPGPLEPTACSGALIAPSVLLTAGHCAGATGATKFTVTCPYLGLKDLSATAEAHPAYINPGCRSVVPKSVDLGLIYLKQRIPLDRYPRVRSTPLPNGSLVVNVGRTLNLTVTNALYVGAPVKVYPSTTVELPGGLTFPYDYVSTVVIQGGDSGGPTYFNTTAGPEIVAANSGSDTTINYQILARTDLVFPWIAARVNEHGGFQWPAGMPPVTPEPLPFQH